MPASILRATYTSGGPAEPGTHIRWPDDGPQLLEQQWAQIAPALDALTSAVGTKRIAVDEAMALPEFVAMAAIRRLSLADNRDPVCLSGDPVSVSSLAALAVSVAYAEDRVAGMPLDVVGKLHPQLRAIPALAVATGAVAACRDWVRQLGDQSRWVAEVEQADYADRAARVLSLIGVHSAANPGEPAHRVARIPSGYELRITLRGAHKESVRLARSGNELLVTTDGVTVPVALTSVLRRCVVSGAQVVNDELVVEFAIDKGKWRS